MTDPILLTPGPLTTAAETRAAMGRDFGSRDDDFIAINARVRQRLLAIANAAGSHVCVPIQGSGTFAVEAMLGTLVPKGGKALVLRNGAYGRRIADILARIGRACVTYDTAEETPPDPAEVDARLAADPALSHVVMVHCETTTGILNPLAEVARVVAGRGRAVLVDAMSSFGALPIDAAAMPFAALAASANKCLEGVPGLGFVLCRRQELTAAGGNAHSVALDLHAQAVAMDRDGQWRFTPPTQVIAALDRALDRHGAEGGTAGRGARYAANCRLLIDGLTAMGFATLLPPELQAPIIVTVRMPADPAFVFDAFYRRMREKGYVLYPGKLAGADSFRVGCIGAIGAEEIRGALAAMDAVLEELGTTTLGSRRRTR